LPERSGIPCAFGGPVVRGSLLTLPSVVDESQDFSTEAWIHPPGEPLLLAL